MYTQNILIKKLREKFSDKYSYEFVSFVNLHTPIILVCPKHGNFEQKPSVLVQLRCRGCKKCNLKTEGLSYISCRDDFIREASKTHNNIYDYSEVIYEKSKGAVTIICPEHGKFSMRARHHIDGQGCARCLKSLRKEKSRNNIKLKNKIRYIANPDYYKKKSAEYRTKNPEKAKRAIKNWHNENPTWKKDYQQNRRKEDVNFRLSQNLRNRLSRVLRGKIKGGSAVSDLGCSVDKLLQHLEVLFKLGMSWDNYGHKKGIKCWHIDHIIPLAAFDLTDREQFLAACHYTNLQPLWAEENMRKGAKIL